MSENILELRNLRKVFAARSAGMSAGIVAVDDVSFDVVRGSS